MNKGNDLSISREGSVNRISPSREVTTTPWTSSKAEMSLKISFMAQDTQILPGRQSLRASMILSLAHFGVTATIVTLSPGMRMKSLDSPLST